MVRNRRGGRLSVFRRSAVRPGIGRWTVADHSPLLPLVWLSEMVSHGWRQHRIRHTRGMFLDGSFRTAHVFGLQCGVSF